MDLEKYIRPDGSTYWAIEPADPNDKLFVEELPAVDVSPKKRWLIFAILGAAAYYIFRK